MTIDTLINVLATGGQHLGDLVWWSLAEAQVDRTTLETRWTTAGLAPEFLPEPPTPEKAFKLAAREAQVGQPDRLVRLAKDDEESLVFAVVHEQKHDDGTLIYNQEARVSLDHLTASVSTDEAEHEVVASIKTRYDRLRDTHTADDIRRVINRTLQSFSSVLLRDNGGVWWVPAPHARTLRKLQSAIEAIGSSRFYLLPVHDSADGNRALGDAAQKSIEEELEALKTEIEKFVQNPPERPTTLVRRFDAFEALRARAQLYRDILNVQVKDLDTTLDQLSESVEKLLDEKAA